MKTNPRIVAVVEKMRERFGSSRPLSRALDDSVDPGLLLAQAARDSAYAEVLQADEVALADLSKIPGVERKTPDADSEAPQRSSDHLTDYLDSL